MSFGDLEDLMNNTENIRKELRKELRSLKRNDNNVDKYIQTYEELTGLKVSSKNITADQLNDLIMFITNEQLVKEREERNKRGGII